MANTNGFENVDWQGVKESLTYLGLDCCDEKEDTKMAKVRIEKAAEILGTTPNTIRNYIDTGVLDGGVDEQGYFVKSVDEIARFENEGVGADYSKKLKAVKAARKTKRKKRGISKGVLQETVDIDALVAPWYSKEDVAKILGVYRDTPNKWMRTGELKSRVFKNRRWVKREELIEFIKAHTHTKRAAEQKPMPTKDGEKICLSCWVDAPVGKYYTEAAKDKEAYSSRSELIGNVLRAYAMHKEPLLYMIYAPGCTPKDNAQ